MFINILYEIERLVQYGLNKKMIGDYDISYTRNRLLEVLNLYEAKPFEVLVEDLEYPQTVLDKITEWALEKGLIENDNITERELFDTKLMGCVVPRPSEVVMKFRQLYQEDIKASTDYLYELSQNSNYIRMDRIRKDKKWKLETEYGQLDITINLSKPEKDPKEIAAARVVPQGAYPVCLLCRENEGYPGRLNHPARQNLRMVPVELNSETWYLQYSPYVYYNEHCIVFKEKHEPMKITRETFVRLLDFVGQFPHYTIGSNADLPIVGGSILSHDHYQGGRYEFPMAGAEVEKSFRICGFDGITVGRVKWPLSVIRVEGENKDEVVKVSDFVMRMWKKYSDITVDIISHTGDIPHNTITPIARMKDEKYQIDLVLRNNRTSDKYPKGIFHPHNEIHHIKRENIGLIEVMGLAVLPGRLNEELSKLSTMLIEGDSSCTCGGTLPASLNDKMLNGDSSQASVSSLSISWDNDMEKHRDWHNELIEKYPDINRENVDEIIKKEVGLKFLKALEHCGVFKRDKEGIGAFDRFIECLESYDNRK